MRKEKALRSVMAMLLALCLCLAALAGCEQKGRDAQDASDKKTEENPARALIMNTLSAFRNN